ncbi:MAG TPA: PEP-CTERM sorting domain-containing protein [Caulobacteraceae bacterium]|jgi:hypothetical protein
MKLDIKATLAGCAVAASLLLASSASATVLTWTLDNAVFDDGGTATGSFDFNTATNAYFNINIVTTAGSVVTVADTFTTFEPNSVVRNSGFGSITGPGNDTGTDELLDINASAPANFDTAGTVAIGAPTIFQSAEGLCAVPCTAYFPARILSGDVVGVVDPVPEPASWALMAIGLGALGAGLRSRRALAAAA